MFFIDHKDVVQQVENFQRLGIAFKVKAGNSRMYIQGEMGDYMTGNNKIPMRELVYIDLVKKHIVREQLYANFPILKKPKIDYYRHSKKIRSMKDLKNCYEVDLKSAYWEMANKMGLLDPAMYAKASTINPKTNELYMGKLTRLAAIGSLARKFRIYKFDEDGNMTKRREHSKLTAHLWDHICIRVADIMNRAVKAAGNEFVFFWVDAMFVSSAKARDKVIASFKDDGYKFSVMPVQQINFKDKIEVRASAHKRPKRNFPYPPVKKKKSRRQSLVFKIN